MTLKCKENFDFLANFMVANAIVIFEVQALETFIIAAHLYSRMHLHQTTTDIKIKLQQNSHPKCFSLLHLQQQTLTLKHNVFQATMEAYELKLQTFCSSKFQQNFIVINAKGGDLNSY
jgi:hypothetical protein